VMINNIDYGSCHYLIPVLHQFFDELIPTLEVPVKAAPADINMATKSFYGNHLRPFFDQRLQRRIQPFFDVVSFRFGFFPANDDSPKLLWFQAKVSLSSIR
ncbi:MAG: hypothetical protein P8Y12_04755, partial [Gammaproteobacteria bacterium]